MRWAQPKRGENSGPGKDCHRELDPRTGIREQPGSKATVALSRAASAGNRKLFRAFFTARGYPGTKFRPEIFAELRSRSLDFFGLRETLRQR
jgi:hypothetical protein